MPPEDQPDDDIHGECRAEIERLEQQLVTLREKVDLQDILLDTNPKAADIHALEQQLASLGRVDRATAKELAALRVKVAWLEAGLGHGSGSRDVRAGDSDG